MPTPGEESTTTTTTDDKSTATTTTTDDKQEELTPEQIKELRDQAAQVQGLSDKIKELEDASKSEADKLKEKADLADKLSPQVESYKKVLQAEVDTAKAALPKEVAALMPAGDDLAKQLEWIRLAQKVKPGTTLPPAGGRNPGGAADTADSKAKIENGQKTFHTLKGRRVKGS